MKKYFLHLNNETIGPFDLVELKARSITKKTPVWFEGMEHWKTAEEIPELTSLFLATPPPISYFSATPPTPKEKIAVKKRQFLGLPINTFLIIVGVLALTTTIIVLKTIQENRRRELKIKNQKTEVENYQYQLQQKEIEEQKLIVAQEEKAAAERILKGKKDTANRRLLEIQQTIEDYQNKLNVTEKKLINASDFKFLRTEADKREQLDLLQNNINFYKTEMVKLRNESDQLKLELEKIPL